MYLSRLEILGFKSFPHRTELLFNPGLTAIVGPNGCGKTNLLDALRWALGEQKISLLRSDKLEEVIFNGSQDAKPLSMAEVSLVVDNNKGLLPTEFSQVTVTRRVFRSGESEYSLNGVPCRLKDIIDLFSDTGMGAHAYSVIEQNMIEQIISGRTEDRRFLFEEAAGVSKYKMRRKAAQKKLETTQADLLRLADITAEVEKQVNTLKRQMRKAEKYRTISTRLKKLELREYKTEFDKLLQSKESASSHLSDVSLEKETRTSRLSKEELELENLRLKYLEIEKEVESCRKEVSQISSQIYEKEKELISLKEKKESYQSTVLRAEEILQHSSSKKQNLESQLESQHKLLLESKAQFEALEKVQNQTEKEAAKLEQKFKEKKKESEELSQLKIQKDRDLEILKKDLQNLNLRLKEETSNLENALLETDKLEERLLSVENQIASLSREIQKLEAENKKYETEKAGWQESYQKNLQKQKELEKQLSASSSELVSYQAQLGVLQKMLSDYEGYSEAVKSIMPKKSQFPGLVDTVANLVHISPDYQVALEVALGEYKELLICATAQAAARVREQVRKENSGRINLLVLENLKTDEKDSPIPQALSENIIGRMSELVSVAGEYKKVASLLLSKVILVKNWDTAMKLSQQLPPDFTLVTLEGESLRPGRIISTGSPAKISVVGRKTENERIEAQVQLTGENIDKLEKQIKKLEQHLQQSLLALTELENKQKEASSFKQQLDLKLNTLNFEKVSLGESKNKQDEEIARLKKVKETLSAEENKLKNDYQTKAEAGKKLEQEVTTSNLDLEHSQTELENLFQKLNQMRLELVTLKGGIEKIESEKKHLVLAREEVMENLTHHKEEIQKAGAWLEESHTKFEKITSEQNLFLEQKDKKTDVLSALQEKLAEQKQNLSHKEGQLKSLRQQKDETLDSFYQLELQQKEIESKIQNLKEKVQDQYEINLEEVTPEELVLEFSDNPEEEIENLKQSLKSLGPVNLLALEDYQKEKERFEFLQKQIQDLVTAKEDLNSTIGQINETARSMFLATFEKVKENFQKVFGVLFEGGETDLKLVGEDPLEADIEITARPRGKRLLNLTQLSGGEKALVALSLLFGIYLVKPSPFCVLDEVDAPLDDANLERFLKLVKKFSDNTQFIIITHNKMTMDAADILYGVTMEKSGISKIVSVRLEKEGVAAI